MGGEGVANGEGSPIYDGHDPLNYHLVGCCGESLIVFPGDPV